MVSLNVCECLRAKRVFFSLGRSKAGLGLKKKHVFSLRKKACFFVEEKKQIIQKKRFFPQPILSFGVIKPQNNNNVFLNGPVLGEKTLRKKIKKTSVEEKNNK